MSSTTHLAGPLVVLSKQDLAVQRCALCGAALSVVRPSRIGVVSTRPDDHGILEFAQAHLIEVTEGNPKRFLDKGDFREVEKLPANFCIDLVEMESP